jgi:hypothetical protein
MKRIDVIHGHELQLCHTPFFGWLNQGNACAAAGAAVLGPAHLTTVVFLATSSDFRSTL